MILGYVIKNVVDVEEYIKHAARKNMTKGSLVVFFAASKCAIV